MASSVKENALSTDRFLHLKCLVDFELVNTFFGDPAESFADELWVESVFGADLLFNSEGIFDCFFVSWWQQLQVVKRKVASIF